MNGSELCNKQRMAQSSATSPCMAQSYRLCSTANSAAKKAQTLSPVLRTATSDKSCSCQTYILHCSVAECTSSSILRLYKSFLSKRIQCYHTFSVFIHTSPSVHTVLLAIMNYDVIKCLCVYMLSPVTKRIHWTQTVWLAQNYHDISDNHISQSKLIQWNQSVCHPQNYHSIRDEWPCRSVSVC